MKEPDVFTKYKNLLPYNGKKVCIKGKYIKHNLMPDRKTEYPFYLSGILMEKDKVPQIFLEQPRNEKEQDSLDGKIVKVIGIFHIEQPLKDGDPEYIAKIRGSWIYDIQNLEIVE